MAEIRLDRLFPTSPITEQVRSSPNSGERRPKPPREPDYEDEGGAGGTEDEEPHTLDLVA
jgi:hypothetical protein